MKWEKKTVKKVLKIVMVAAMILGIAFSISNLMHRKVKAQGVTKNGQWIECPDGSFRCGGKGTECVKGGIEY